MKALLLAALSATSPAWADGGGQLAAPSAEQASEAAALLQGLEASPEYRAAAAAAAEGEEPAPAAKAKAVMDSVLGGFDGAQAREGAPAVSAGTPPGEDADALFRPALAASEPLPAPGEAAVPPVPAHVTIFVEERGSTYWSDLAEKVAAKGGEKVWHGIWAGDLLSTVVGIAKGIAKEANPLYKLFGATNPWGVALSIIVMHLLLTRNLRRMLRKMRAAQGAEREAWAKVYLTALAAGMLTHLLGLVNNIGVISR